MGGDLGPFTDDMALRHTATGALLLYSIRNDKLASLATRCISLQKAK